PGLRHQGGEGPIGRGSAGTLRVASEAFRPGQLRFSCAGSGYLTRIGARESASQAVRTRAPPDLRPAFASTGRTARGDPPHEEEPHDGLEPVRAAALVDA